MPGIDIDLPWCPKRNLKESRKAIWVFSFVGGGFSLGVLVNFDHDQPYEKPQHGETAGNLGAPLVPNSMFCK